MRRFSRPLLAALLVLLALLALITALLLKKPAPAAADDDDEDDAPAATASSTAASGPRFDNTFGSLAALVPQGGTPPVLSAGAGIAGSGMADSGGVAMVVEHGPQYRDIAWLQAQGNEAFTLQVLGARSEASVKQFIAGQKDPDQFHYFQSADANGQPWFVVIYGNFGSRVQAVGAAADLDFGLNTRPFAKAFSDYAAEMSHPVPAATSAPIAPSP